MSKPSGEHVPHDNKKSGKKGPFSTQSPLDADNWNTGALSTMSGTGAQDSERSLSFPGRSEKHADRRKRDSAQSYRYAISDKIQEAMILAESMEDYALQTEL